MMIFSVKVALFALALPLSTFASVIVPKSLKSFTQRDLNDVKTNAERLARGMPLIAPRVPSPSREHNVLGAPSYFRLTPNA